MAGYTRQSVADIIANAVIKAAPVNAEYNALRDAFAFSGGHRHDGSSDEGAYVPLIADTDANNKVVIDTANNRISIFVEVGGTAVEQVRIQDGAIVPVTDNDVDLGAVGAEFKDIYIDGIGYIDTIQVHENATIAGTLGVTGLSTLASVDINGGNIDGTIIGAATPAAVTATTVTSTAGITGNVTGNLTGNVTGNTAGTHTGSVVGNVTGNVTSSGTSTFATVDINGGAIDGTTIGSSTKAAGGFTTVTTTGQATLASADINGGTVDGAVIGATTPAAITGTTITANTGITGTLTGNVTGNVTGNLTGNVTGNITGNVTGNVTASSGTSTFNDVVINGGLNMNAGTAATITNLTTPTNSGDAATKGYVDTSIANLVDSAPTALDTLNELAAALGDDANFSTTITNSIATKLPLAGGTMSGGISMGTNRITSLADPSSNQDAATKNYVDTQDATKLSLSGGTMTGNIVMGANKVTSTATPTADGDLTTKVYVDAILGSATAAATSAAAAAVSETNAATSETNAAASEAAAAGLYDQFDDRYLGSKSSAPSVDNDGNTLLEGALYWNSTTKSMYIWNGSAWSAAVFDTAGAMFGVNNLSDVASAAASRTNLGLGTAATTDSTDYATAAQGALADSAVQPNDSPTFAGLTVDTNTLYVDSTNNRVGIGTSSPAERLHVQADDPNIWIDSTSIGETSFNGGRSSNGGLLLTALDMNTTSKYTPAIMFGSTDPDLTTNNPRIGAAIVAEAAQTFSADTTGSMNLTFWTRDGTLTTDQNAVERMRINSTGSVGIGTTSPSEQLSVVANVSATNFYVTSSGDTSASGISGGFKHGGINSKSLIIEADPNNVGSNTAMLFYVDASERMRIDSSGNVGIGTSSPSEPLTVDGNLRLEGASYSYVSNSSDAGREILLLRGKSSVADGGAINLYGDGDPTAPNQIVFFTSGNASGRFDASGNLLVGKSSNGISIPGVQNQADGSIWSTVDGATSFYINRLTNDGTLVSFRQAGTQEGSISVSGTTVSYNGGHLSRWSQMADGSRPDLLKGTVMTNLDQMANWDGEANEQLNCTEVSTVEGDANVAGVFVAWDSEDDGYNDILLAMTGDMVIRIAQGVTVQRGDLLMSAGDGTAKPQGDDIVRSKTIAKVTSTNVSHTYEDGSYCVPCVLMAC